MLAIRLKRYGKTHFATYRIVIQDAMKHPSSGKIVAYVGSYNPHTKEANFDKEQIEKYLNNGAQPSARMVKLLMDAKIKLPSWVEKPDLKKAGTTRNPDKLRKNRPAEAVKEPAPAATEPEPKAEAEVPAESAEEVVEETPAAEADTEPTEEAKTEEAPETSDK